MRLLLLLAISLMALTSAAQKAPVVYLESVGNGGTRVFSVQTPVKETEIFNSEGRAKLKPAEIACYLVIKSILFDGVDNYNQGTPLVANANDSFAKSVINLKNKAFMTYCKETDLENSVDNKMYYHYIVEVNHFNLLRLLKMRGSRTEPYLD